MSVEVILPVFRMKFVCLKDITFSESSDNAVVAHLVYFQHCSFSTQRRYRVSIGEGHYRANP